MIAASDKKWSFRGLSFARIVSDNFQRRPEQRAIASISYILDTEDRYVDIGGVSTAPFQIRAAFDNQNDADTLMGYVATVGQLVRTGGWAGNRILMSVSEVFVAPGLFVVDCSFE